MTSQDVHLGSRHDGRQPRLRRALVDDRGAATAELVLATPLLLLLIMLIAQFTLWLHASHIAQAAASEALSVTRVQDGTAASGDAEARRVLGQLGQGPLRDPHVTVTRGAAQSAVHVEGRVTVVVPWLHLTATGDAVGPIERFRDGVQP